jgi:hypothetical protein
VAAKLPRHAAPISAQGSGALAGDDSVTTEEGDDIAGELYPLAGIAATAVRTSLPRDPVPLYIGSDGRYCRPVLGE